MPGGRRRYHTGMTPMPLVDATDAAFRADALAEALRTHGACRLPAFPDAAATHALREDVLRLRASGALSPASVGRGTGRGLHGDIRGDATLWLDDPRAGGAAAAFLAELDALRAALNRRLFLGIDEVEAHYAAYPTGAFYARHRDRFRDSDARVVSVVTYLNPDWSATDGGALRIALDTVDIDVKPDTGSIVFLSELEHEVLPATRERFSIAAWMRRRA